MKEKCKNVLKMPLRQKKSVENVKKIQKQNKKH